MNLKKLLSVATLFVAGALGFNANAQYTADDLTSSGWTEVAELTNIADNYYVLVSKTKDFSVDANSNDNLIHYRTLTNPLTDLYKVWTIEQNGDYHSLRNVGNTNPRFVQTEWESAWNLDFNDQWNLCEWTNFKFAYNSDGTYWTIENGKFPATEDMNDDKNGYWGPRDNGGESVVVNEMRIAGNKKSGNVGQYRIFQMSKTDFHKKLISTGNFPMPFTEYINNPYINGADGWIIERPNGGNGPLLNNNAFEYWYGEAKEGNFNYYQEIDVPNGKYVVSAYMYNSTNGENNATFNPEGQCGVYATSGDVTVFKPVNVDGTGYLEYTTDEITVTNKKLRIGVKNNTTMTARWFVADNFKLICNNLYISALSTPFAGSGFLEADKWYVYDVVNSGKYDFSATEGIVYTQVDQLQDIVKTTPATSTIELEAGKLYFKSGTAQELSIVPNTYGYTLDEPTKTTSITDGSRLKSLTTFAVTYPNAMTNNPSASLAILDNDAVATLKKGETIVATGSLSANGNTLTATFDEVKLDIKSIYTISIPEGIFGFKDGAVNEKVVVEFHSPAIADGTYYFKRNETETYLTRGGNWGTEAVTDKFGIAFEAITQNDGTYHFKNVDHSLAEGVDRYLSQYTDAGSAEKWEVVSTEGGYYLKRGGKYLKTKKDGYWEYNYIDDTDNSAEAIVWTILTVEEYKQSLVARKNNEAKVVAEKAGLTVEDLAGLESALSELTKMNATDRIVNAELINNNTTGWTAVSYNGARRNQAGEEGSKYDVIRTNNCAEVWAYVGGAEQTISNLPEGIYKVTVKATWRLANEEEAKRVGENANVTAWMYANDNYTQLKRWSEGSPKNNNDLVDSNDDSYVNTVYVYVSGEEDLTIGIASPSWCRETWMPFCHWTLTKYAQETTANMTITEGAGWATFIAPFDVEIPEGVTAYTVSGVEGTILTKEEVKETIQANTPVLLKGEEGLTYTDGKFTQTFYGGSTATQNTYGEVLVGNVSGKTMNVSAGSYVLLNQKNKLGFYQVKSDEDNVTVGNNRCYLNVPAGSEIKAFFFDDEATGINGVETLTDGAVESIYTINGTRVNSLQKGLNIVKMSSGKTQKVLVK